MPAPYFSAGSRGPLTFVERYLTACLMRTVYGEFCARDYEPALATVVIAGSPVHRARAAEGVDGRLPRALRPRTNEIISLASSLGFVARRWLPLWGNGGQSGLIESFVR